MPVTDLNQLSATFAAAFNAGDAGALLDLYESDATLVAQPGKTAVGHEDIRAAIEAFLALQFKIEIETKSVLTGGIDLALVRSSWRLKSGESVTMSGESIEVLRRDDTGAWRYAIDNPFGDAT
ncbi:MAG TPA: SgcJ/EcaC family oxidoreductase [Bryobacteraceae bacterium]|nr:SgcJ/EcaC family oxidoreductase [Bryobacteraceae bacterium]